MLIRSGKDKLKGMQDDKNMHRKVYSQNADSSLMSLKVELGISE